MRARLFETNWRALAVASFLASSRKKNFPFSLTKGKNDFRKMLGRLRSGEKKSAKTKRDASDPPVKKSPSRTKSPRGGRKTPTRKPSKSPARKSPSRRSPVRKSPSRRTPVTKSPSRRSPTRRTPVSTRIDNEDKKTSHIKSRSTPIVDIDTDSDDPYVCKVRKPQITVRSRARRSTSDYKNKDVENDEANDRNLYGGISHRTVILSSSREAESVFPVKETVGTFEHKLSEFSDEDDLKKPIDSIESTPSQQVFAAEFGGWFGALFFIAFLPFEVVFLNVICNEKKCTFSPPLVQERFEALSTYLDLSAGLGFATFVILLALLSALPFGGKKVQGFFNKNGKLNYVMNGSFCAATVHLILFGLELNEIPVVDLIYDKYFQLAVSSVVLGMAFAIYLYVRSFFVPVSALNPNGDTNSVIYNFFIGREINPRMGEVVDVKMLLIRITHVSVVVLNSVLLCKSLGLNSPAFRENYDLNSLYFHPTLLAILSLLYVYFMDGLVFEHAWISSFEVQHEGVGYMSCVGFTSGAFIYGIIPKYVMDFEVELCPWQLVASVVQFLIGYALYRGSNSQKYAFRKNPYSPAVAHLETIPTSRRKKLIVSGFWGFVRHPNYLGDILMHLAFLYYVISAPPAITCLMAALILIHRAERDGFHCKQKYEAAWDRYCQRVKYVLIPKVY